MNDNPEYITKDMMDDPRYAHLFTPLLRAFLESCDNERHKPPNWADTL